MKITIRYCTVWNHLPRVVTLVDGILNEHKTDITSFELTPSTGGVFDVYVNDNLVFSRKAIGRMPEENEIENIIKVEKQKESTN